MRVAYALVALICAAFAAPIIRSGMREWRDAGGTPVLRRYGLLADEETRAGWARGGLIMGLGLAFMVIMLAGLAVVDLRDVSRAESLVFAVAAAGMIVCFGLYFTILVVNRPKFLVPRQHRGELGAFAASRRRRREGRHAR